MSRLSKLFRSNRTKPTMVRRTRLACETLEERRVLSGNYVTMFDPNLTAVVQPGTNGQKDHIELVNGACGTPDTDQIVTLHSMNFNPNQPTEIYTKQGNDSVFNNTAVGIYVDAGDGNDYVSGGSGADVIYGGTGKDTLM